LQTSDPNIHQVPILSWEAALHWPHFSKCQDAQFAYLPILSHQASAQTFALLLNNDVMESPHGLSFPQGGFILVDSLREVSPNQYVLVRTERPQNLLFRQLILDAGRYYLKPLNPRYPITTLPQDATFLGVITQLQLPICP
jgi:SOS-response transcriptional repressor LexA